MGPLVRALDRREEISSQPAKMSIIGTWFRSRHPGEMADPPETSPSPSSLPFNQLSSEARMNRISAPHFSRSREKVFPMSFSYLKIEYPSLKNGFQVQHYRPQEPDGLHPSSISPLSPSFVRSSIAGLNSSKNDLESEFHESWEQVDAMSSRSSRASFFLQSCFDSMINSPGGNACRSPTRTRIYCFVPISAYPNETSGNLHRERKDALLYQDLRKVFSSEKMDVNILKPIRASPRTRRSRIRNWVTIFLMRSDRRVFTRASRNRYWTPLRLMTIYIAVAFCLQRIDRIQAKV